MFLDFFRNSKIAAYLLAAFRIIVGIEWVQAGWGKFAGEFDASGFFQYTLSADSTATWWHWIVENIFLNDFVTPMINFMIPVTEVLIGILLIVGLFTRFSGFVGLTCNFAFLLSGAISINPQMILLTLPILVSGNNGGHIGLDRFATPYINKKILKK